MTKVIYNGSSHFRELGAADLKKAGVDGFTKTSFAKGESVEVDDAVAQALVNDSVLFGAFSIDDSKSDTPLDGVDGDSKAPAKSK